MIYLIFSIRLNFKKTLFSLTRTILKFKVELRKGLMSMSYESFINEEEIDKAINQIPEKN